MPGHAPCTVRAGTDGTSFDIDDRDAALVPATGRVRLLIDGGTVGAVVDGRVFGAPLAGGEVDVVADVSLDVWTLDR